MKRAAIASTQRATRTYPKARSWCSLAYHQKPAEEKQQTSASSHEDSKRAPEMGARFFMPVLVRFGALCSNEQQ
jgi:hypothetical protein